MASAGERGSRRRSIGAHGFVAAGPNCVVSLSASIRKGNAAESVEVVDYH
jgi:hypothetical protein